MKQSKPLNSARRQNSTNNRGGNRLKKRVKAVFGNIMRRKNMTSAQGLWDKLKTEVDNGNPLIQPKYADLNLLYIPSDLLRNKEIRFKTFEDIEGSQRFNTYT